MDTSPAYALDLRVLKFRSRPEQEDPAMLALELLSAGRVHDAIDVVDAALERDPDDVDVLLSCGIAARRAGKLAFAQLVLTRACQRSPGWPDALRALSEVLALRGKEARSLEVARRAVAAGARDPELVACVRADDLRRALDARMASLRADHTSEDPALLAQALLSAGRHADAIDVAALAEDDADARHVAAQAYLALGDRDGALAALERAIALAPEWPEPAILLATMRAEEGALCEALAIVERALASNVDDEALLALRAEIEQRLRDLASGDEALDGLLGTLDQIDPIGDETRRGFERCDTSPGTTSTDPVPQRSKRRGGWLPALPRSLFARPKAWAEEEQATSAVHHRA